MAQVQYTVEPQGRPLAVMVSIATLEKLVEALNIVLDCRPIGYETMTEMREAKIRSALTVGRAALSNAEPKKISLTNTATGSLPQRVESIFEAMDKEVAAGRLVRTGPMEWRKL